MVTMVVSLSFPAGRPEGGAGPKKSADSTQPANTPPVFPPPAAACPSPRRPGRSAARKARRQALEGAHEPFQAAALHALHEALHLLELPQQAVDVLDLHARSAGDAPRARAV